MANSIIKTDSSQAKSLLSKAQKVVDEISAEPLNPVRKDLLTTYIELIKKLNNQLPKTPPSTHKLNNATPLPLVAPVNNNFNIKEYNNMLFHKANNHIQLGDNYIINFPLEAKREYESALDLLKTIHNSNNSDKELIFKVNTKITVVMDKINVLKKLLDVDRVKNNTPSTQTYNNNNNNTANPPKPNNTNSFQTDSRFVGNRVLQTV